MEIKQRVIKHLEKLAAKGPREVEAVLLDPEQGYLVGISPEGEGSGLSLNLEAYDRFSVTMRHLEVYNPDLTVTDSESYLGRVAEQICQRLIYLDEPLTLVELDKVENIAQLRSELPQTEALECSYWEVLVYTTPHPHAKLRRYHWSAGASGRQLVSSPMTFATIGRLADDLARSMNREQ
jgi:hypothetical protein